MEKIPDLPKEVLLSHLDVSDLLACSLVSVQWRAAANCDQAWKRICYQTSNKTTIDHLKKVHPTITPLFENPECPSERLEPLCYWRWMYMKLSHVKRNWQRANHETHQVTEMAYNFYEIKIENDLLVANVNDNHCEVWNVKGTPRKQETIVCALKETQCKCLINLYNDRLTVVQDSLLQVYSRSGKTFSLCFRRLFNQPESASSNIPGSLNIDEWYKEQVKKRPTHLQAFHVGEYFIGVAQNRHYKNSSFHVWNIVSGAKLKEERINDICPEMTDVSFFKFCPSKSSLHEILLCVHHRIVAYVYLYDLRSLSFLKLQVLSPREVIVYYEDSIFITIDDTKTVLSVFKSSDGKEITNRSYEEVINLDSVQVHRDYLGFITGGDLVVLNTTDYDLVFTTAIVKFSSSVFGFDFVFLNWDLVLIARWDEVNKIEVWDIKEKSHKSTLQASGLMFPCKNQTKFFVWNEMVTSIYMLQFW